MNIFVAKLNFRTTSEALRSLFEQFGQVESARIITDHETGRSKGFGFVEMPDDNEAQQAIDQLNDTEFEERVIVVKKALPQEKRPQSNFRPHGGGNDRYGRGGNGGGGNRFNNPYQNNNRY